MPEAVTPYDAKKLSASVSYVQPDRRVAWTVAFGQNREIHGNLEAYLLEGRMQIAPADAGFHPPGTFHRHRQSQVSALTVG